MKVYAFEWCDCVYESGHSVESLHASKESAEAAMAKAVKRKQREDKRFERETGIKVGNPMWSARVRALSVRP